MDATNKQHDKTLNGVSPTSVQRKERPGADPHRPTNADYDYRPDFGESGGAVEHNPEVNKNLPRNTSDKSTGKPKGKK